ncbi:hypothetical protein DRJ58_01650 [Candidatus Acetothermia bacterium]|nr:MAG: hypothetical protein DRJ58_01650 [Candidatus Acetothermia bacterium]
MTSRSSPPEPHPDDGLLARVLSWISNLLLRRTELVLLCAAALALLALQYIRYLPLKSSVFDLLPPDDPLVATYKEVEEILTPTDFAAVLLTLEDPPASLAERERILIEAATRLERELDDPEIRGVSFRIGEGIEVPPELLLFYQLDPETLSRLREIAREVLSIFPPLQVPRGRALGEALPQAALADLSRVGKIDPGKLRAILGEAQREVEAARELVSRMGEIPRLEKLLHEAGVIITELLSRPPPKAQPLFSPDRTRLLVQIWPRRPSYTGVVYCRKITRTISAAVRRAELGKLGVRAGITGNYVAVAQGQALIAQDLSRTTWISAVGVFVVLIVSLGSVIAILATVLPLLVSAVLTVAWAKFSVGGFNLITVFLPALVLGLGVDYSLHLVSRVMEEIRKGEDLPAALAVAMRTKGSASLGAALTTALAFTSLVFARSLGLKEMGIIMALGIFFALGSALLIGPALLVAAYRASQGRFRPRGLGYERKLFRPYRLLLYNRWAVIALTILLTGAVAYQASRVEFEFVPGELSPTTEAQRVAQEAMRALGGEIAFNDDFLIFVRGSRMLREVTADLSSHPGVRSIRSVRDLLPTELLRGEAAFQEIPIASLDAFLSLLEENLREWEGRIAQARNLAVALARGELVAATMGAGEIAAAASKLADSLFRLADAMEAYSPRVPEFLPAVTSMRADYEIIRGFLERLQALPPEEELLRRLVEVLPGDLRAYYYTSEGAYVIHLGLDPQYLEGKKLDRFIAWLEEKGYRYFGFPEVRLRLRQYMQRDFAISTSLAGILILGVLLLNFRSLRAAVVAAMPLVVGYTWMLAGMKFLGIEFNFINISISPLLIGLGVDAGIHVAHRVLEEGPGQSAVARGAAASTMPVLGASLTTMVVFAALLWANTPGLRILGVCALLGLGFSLIASLLFVPAALVRVERPPGAR